MVETDAKSFIDVGSVIDGRYEVLAYVGQGGMGIVYKARDRQFNNLVALKVLFADRVPDAKSVARFQQETRAASRLDHHCLTRVYDFGIAESGQPYFVMEFVAGVTLAQKIAQEGQLSIEEALRIFILVCEGLEHAHGQQIVHRDLKPSNIILTAEGSALSVKILDFGLAKIETFSDEESLNLTRTGQLVGSPYYMSPEQARGGEIDHRSDLYSLGCSMYESLTGGPPHIGTSPMSTLMKRESDPPLPLTEGSLGKSFPEQIENVVARLLNRMPEERFQSAREVKEELLRLLKGEPIKSPPRSPVVQFSTSTGALPITKRAMIIVAGIGVVSIGSGLLVANAISSLKQRQMAAEANIDKERFRMLLTDLPKEIPALPSIASPEIEKSRDQRRKGDFEGSKMTLIGAIDRYHSAFGPESEAEARAYTELGETFIAAKQNENAYIALTKAFQLSWNGGPQNSAALADANCVLADIYKREQDAGKHDHTERLLELYKHAADMYEHLIPQRPIEQGRCLSEMGQILASNGNYKVAELMFKKSIRILSALPQRPMGVLLTARRGLSNCYRDQRRFTEALGYDTETLAIVQESRTPNILQRCTALNQLAADHLGIAESVKKSSEKEHLAAAEALYSQSLKLTESHRAKFSTQRMGAFEGLGFVYAKLAMENAAYIKTADRYYQTALDMCLRDPEHPGIGRKYEKLARLNLIAGDVQKQDRYFVLALKHARPTERNVISDQIDSAAYYRHNKRNEIAESVCKRLLKGTERLYGRDSTEYADVCTEMGQVCLAQKKTGEAQKNLQKALAIYQKTLGPGDSRTIHVAKLLGSG